MKTIKNWKWLSCESNEVILDIENNQTLHIFVLEEYLIRVLIKRNSELRLDKTWSISPNDYSLDWSGRNRLSKAGFTLPKFNSYHQEGNTEESVYVIETQLLRLTIEQPLCMKWEHRINNVWLPLACDRKTGAYQLGIKDHANAHFMARDSQDKFYGLGEKAGELNRHGKRFEMRNLDAMGYDAKTTDPLYKHIPFYITKPAVNIQMNIQIKNQNEQDVDSSLTGAYGLFYDNLSNSWFDLGNELDNYHPKYKSYRAEDGDLDYYFIYAESIKKVTKRFVQLTGKTFFGPKWSLGYSGSTMYYTDEPNSQTLLEGFVDLCAQHGMPCDSFQLSSGYTSIGNKRYVFNWNTDKVPQPNKMSDYFHQHGMKLAANIKPCLLHDHPRYQEAKLQKLFIEDSASSPSNYMPEISVFWDADGSHLDFTNPDTVSWWKKNVTEQLLEKGIDSTWNDNNEYEIWDRSAKCFGFGQPIDISLIRPLQPLLMMRASYEAQLEFSPEKRPYLISRSGCPGMQRYVQTWSGDNRTSWSNLKYNIKMGLGMSLSGLYNVGHDVGGFSGDKPNAELFVRWVQSGVMHPRFTIHSWNDDGSVNEPWMYPHVTPIIRQMLALRYRLLPYIYDALYKAHQFDEPILRPTFLDHEHDHTTFNENDDYLFGTDLLVASVVCEGQREREVYLPDNKTGWYDFYRGQWYAGKQTVTVPAPLEQIPFLVRAGAVIPMSERIAAVNHQQDDQRILAIYPLQGIGKATCSIFDDDGESYAYLNNGYLSLSINMECDHEQVALTITKQGNYVPAYEVIQLRLPALETRKLVINGKTISKGQALKLSDL